jgi:hypothetical protein
MNMRRSQDRRNVVLFVLPVISNGAEEHTSNGMMDTTAIAFDGWQRRLIGILLVQPLWNAAHEFRYTVATCILCAILELLILKDPCIINVVLGTYCAIKLLSVVGLGFIDFLLEVRDKPNKFF